MLDAMTTRETGSSAGQLISDPLSQVLFLKDALATGSGPALVRALNEIVHIWGFAQLVERVQVDQAVVDRALRRTERADFAELQSLIETMIKGWDNLGDADGGSTDQTAAKTCNRDYG